MNKYFKIYLVGLGILATAVMLNLFAKPMRLTTWYDFLKNTGEAGLFNTLVHTNPGSILFIFIIYPFFLGLSAFILNKITG